MKNKMKNEMNYESTINKTLLKEDYKNKTGH